MSQAGPGVGGWEAADVPGDDTAWAWASQMGWKGSAGSGPWAEAWECRLREAGGEGAESRDYKVYKTIEAFNVGRMSASA